MLRRMLVFGLWVMILRWVFSWLIWVAWFVIRLALVGVTTWWVGVPHAVTQMAHEWVARATRAGLPYEYAQALYYAACTLGVGVVIISWIILAYTTVGIMRMVL